jgi:hypothetical protein
VQTTYNQYSNSIIPCSPTLIMEACLVGFLATYQVVTENSATGTSYSPWVMHGSAHAALTSPLPPSASGGCMPQPIGCKLRSVCHSTLTIDPVAW